MASELARLQLRCLGPPTALLDGCVAPPEVLWRKHLALLVYLALSPSRTRTRDHLLGVLWAEQPEATARHALNQAVLRLRRALGEDRLRSEANALALSETDLDVDALKFSALAAGAPDKAVALVRGDFLEGFHVPDAREFDDWMARERDRYRALAAAALVAVAEHQLAEARSIEASDTARRALALAPQSEPAVRILMRAAALAGDAATALAAYREFASGLERTVEEQPARSLQALADRIRGETWRSIGTRKAVSAAVEPPLVGREATHREAFDTVAAGFGRGPRALVITGAPGMGRTRLLEECARRLALEGALVLRARSVESDQDAPWSTLRLLVRGGLANAQGLLAAQPASLSAIAGLAPELAERFPPRDVSDVGDMATALGDVFGAVAEEQPLALTLDDAQWADGSSLAALRMAVGTLQSVPVVLIVTMVQGSTNPPHELLRLASEVGRDVPGSAVRLDAFTQEELAAVVAALAPWCKGADGLDRLTRRISIESGGNPFIAVTLLGALAKASALQADLMAWPPPGGTFDTPLPFSVPSLLRHAVALLVGELGETERQVLSVASICGQVLDVELISAVAERPSALVERALPECERRHLIQFDGRRYVFAAPLIAEVVRAECLPRGEQRRLQRRAAEALTGRSDLEGRALRAELLAHAAPDKTAYELASAVIHDSEKVGADRIRRRAVSAAERIRRRIET